MEFDFGAVLVDWRLLAKGIGWTVGLTAIATLIGMVVGVACAWARSSGPAWLRWGVGTYVELIRNTPFIVQLFFIFFGLPAAGVKLTPETAAVIAMVANLGAYATEIIRAGIEATPRGQIEAAVSLALNKVQVFTRVVLPPALKKVWPAMVSQIIIVMLGSAVCSQISVEDLSYAANLIQSRNFRAFEAFIIATVLYLALSVGLRRLLNWAGPRWFFGR
ncbi:MULTISPECIES: amino acid ABC transporter permease [unclassified Variovorax]|uniref:amino acid ABC transporter permease n=1 Tax=unclassified Variovorax TaxID=663243 RepID=UPI001601BDA6|nr:MULTISPECIES: amino acid ABC transporter permease [unclassified Variovorax]MBB1598871.1 polar amino acid ABC transporter permease [Variovorax sp. UMC13]MDM0087318.1 amino acid ABC transporter permease [Variovorax sp. J22G40]MDM0144425.1 amino acid ABC transporter permease [Variovorax sp. J2P1-31]